MGKIKKFHLYTNDIIEVNQTNSGKTRIINSVWDGMTTHVPVHQRAFTIYGAKLTEKTRENGDRYYATLFGLFRFRKHHTCVGCEKLVKKGEYGIGIHTDYECFITEWGYTDHMCLSCFVDIVGNKKICECIKWGCRFEEKPPKYHYSRKRMIYDLLQEDYGFKIRSRKSDSLRSTGQSGDGSGGGEEEADEDCPSGRLLGISPKIHGGKVEDLDPELQSILKHRKRST